MVDGEGRSARPIPPAARPAAWLRFSIGALVYVVAFGLAFVSAPAALALIGLVAVYYIVERTPAARRPSQGMAGRE